MIALKKLLYDAITADAELMQMVGNRVRSTAFEVSPEAKDNTPLPYIVIRDFGLQAQPETKDCEWMPADLKVQAGIEIGAESENGVDALILRCMRSVARYVQGLEWADTPQLDAISTEGVQWDWMKPCYWDTLHYQCTVDNYAKED